jgi:hypothetical protein
MLKIVTEENPASLWPPLQKNPNKKYFPTNPDSSKLTLQTAIA